MFTAYSKPRSVKSPSPNPKKCPSSCKKVVCTSSPYTSSFSPAKSHIFPKNRMICPGNTSAPLSAYSIPVNNPSVSPSIPSATKPAFGARSNVTGSFPASARNAGGNSPSVASISACAKACNRFQSAFINSFSPPPPHNANPLLIQAQRRNCPPLNLHHQPRLKPLAQPVRIPPLVR